MNKKAFAVLFLGALSAALILRVPRLGLRPMHHDEANQAVKFGALLEKGEYRYDRHDHHGPSLYYLTLPFAWASGARTLAQVDEPMLRAVPLAFGAALLLLLLLVRRDMGGHGMLWAGFLLAVSPAFVFYSRFYIQEMVFLFFILGSLVCVWRYLCEPRWTWAVLAGLFAGLTYATKETCVIVFAAILGAGLAVRFLSHEPGRPRRAGAKAFPAVHILWFVGTAVLVSLILFSAFGRHPSGSLDSLLSFTTYVQRAGDPGWHAHPWYYYLKMLAFSRYGRGPVWTEAMVLFLAVVGILSAFRGGGGVSRGWLRFVAFYTLITTVAFSLISYKTPWNLLPFYLGLVILAGAGAARLVGFASRRSGKVLVTLLLLAGALHLGWQSWRSNDRFFADPGNPYVYAHTSSDLLRLVQRVHDLAPLHPEGRDMLVKVVADPYATWPIPWYLRDFPRVGYWQDAGQAGGLGARPLVIASPEQMVKLGPELREHYQIEFYGLRPEVLIALCIPNELWESFLKTRIE